MQFWELVREIGGENAPEIRDLPRECPFNREIRLMGGWRFPVF